MSLFRRKRATSSRGHVRVEQGPNWTRWIMGAVAAGAALALLMVLITRYLIPAMQADEQPFSNRTWLGYAWTSQPADPSAVGALGRLLEDSHIERVYLEANAWRADGTLVEGENAAAFASSLREANNQISVLLWLRISASQIADEAQRATIEDFLNKAVHEWGLDGVQIHARGIVDGSNNFVDFLRSVREIVGPEKLVSIAAPPDRVPIDPDIPIGLVDDPAYTWSQNYKQRIGLLLIDEFVVMAHASGLSDPAEYREWVAYQIDSYVSALAALENSVEVVIAIPTYGSDVGHDPRVESVSESIAGIKQGIEQTDRAKTYVVGAGLYSYEATDSHEWDAFEANWLNSPDK